MTVNKIAFVCQGNAGRSQLATALAEQERDRRGLDVEIVTGGVDPSEHVHPEVIEVLSEAGIDIGDRTPRQIRPADVADAEYVVTMGCSITDIAPDDWAGTAAQWELEHPNAGDPTAARAQRDEIHRRVTDLFDEIETG